MRMMGIDAPESKQACTNAGGDAYPCGQAAASALRSRVGADPVACEVSNADRYGRAVSKCATPRGDLGAYMVSTGNAVAYAAYSREYVPLEAEARDDRRGIWAGQFEEPAEYRKRKREGAAAGPAVLRQAPAGSQGGGTCGAAGPSPPAEVTGGGANGAQATCGPKGPAVGVVPGSRCVIKGNVSSKGDKVYHVPGGRYYESTIIDEGAGERFFCTEDEAVRAGWRRSQY